MLDGFDFLIGVGHLEGGLQPPRFHIKAVKHIIASHCVDPLSFRRHGCKAEIGLVLLPVNSEGSQQGALRGQDFQLVIVVADQILRVVIGHRDQRGDGQLFPGRGTLRGKRVQRFRGNKVPDGDLSLQKRKLPCRRFVH